MHCLQNKKRELSFLPQIIIQMSLCILLKLLQERTDINDCLFCKSAGIHKVTALNSDPSSTLPLGFQIHPSPLQFQLAREATHFTL